MAPDVRTLLVTAPDRRTAEDMVDAVVRDRLAACGTVIEGAVSIYRWEGRIERSAEAVILLKTTADRAEALRDRLVSLHPYDVPEVLVLDVEGGHLPYLEWVEGEVRNES